jgi:hypothetical protein
MRWEKLRDDVGHRVQLRPVAIHLDKFGCVLPQVDHDWYIDLVSKEGVHMFNTWTNHVTILGADHICEFASNSDRGTRYGFLILKAQIFLSGYDLKICPTSRPGEAVRPPQEWAYRRVRRAWVAPHPWGYRLGGY